MPMSFAPGDIVGAVRLRTGAGSEVVVEGFERAIICAWVMVRLEGANCCVRMFYLNLGVQCCRRNLCEQGTKPHE